MKLKAFAGITFASTLLLGACGGETTDKKEENKTETASAETPKKEAKENNELKDNTAQLNDIDVKVLETEFIPKGTYDGQDKDQLGIIYEVKNKSDKEIDPISGWMAAFEATQDTENTVHKLDVGMLPQTEKYKPFLDTQLDIIKKDGTLKNGIAYDLDTTDTPVILKATKGVGGEKLGEIKVVIRK